MSELQHIQMFAGANIDSEDESMSSDAKLFRINVRAV